MILLCSGHLKYYTIYMIFDCQSLTDASRQEKKEKTNKKKDLREHIL